MRFKKKVLAHVEEQVRDARTVCDGCGGDVDCINMAEAYQRSEVTIEARIGDVFPEGSSRILYETDLCERCWHKKALPALRNAGIAVRTRDEEGSDDGRVWETAP
jgi:hypothetical protein